MSSRSGAEIREALAEGHAVSWGFNPQEKRVVLKLPSSLGGATHILCIAGSYTFTARRPAVEAAPPASHDAVNTATVTNDAAAGQLG
jgi:hypothetical protein